MGLWRPIGRSDKNQKAGISSECSIFSSKLWLSKSHLLVMPIPCLSFSESWRLTPSETLHTSLSLQRLLHLRSRGSMPSIMVLGDSLPLPESGEQEGSVPVFEVHSPSYSTALTPDQCWNPNAARVKNTFQKGYFQAQRCSREDIHIQ